MVTFGIDPKKFVFHDSDMNFEVAHSVYEILPRSSPRETDLQITENSNVF